MKTKVINTVALCLALSIGAAPAQAQETNVLVVDLEPPVGFADEQPQGNNIDVTVAKLHNIDPLDHERIRSLQRHGVPSTISEEQGHTIQTDSTGTVRIENLPPGAYVVRDANTAQPRFNPLVIPFGIDSTTPTITLRPKLIDGTPSTPVSPTLPIAPTLAPPDSPPAKNTPPRLAFTGASVLGLLAIATFSTLIGFALLRARHTEKKG